MNGYPVVGSILVSVNGDALVYVWPNESDHDDCFTGVSLFDSDVSSLWLRTHFEPCNLFKRALLCRFRELRRAAKANRDG